jgi:hypothetical protein
VGGIIRLLITGGARVFNRLGDEQELREQRKAMELGFESPFESRTLELKRLQEQIGSDVEATTRGREVHRLARKKGLALADQEMTRL